MRVAMLGDYPQEESQIIGGPQAVVLSLLRELTAREGMELHLLTCRPNAEPSSRPVYLAGQVKAQPAWTVHILPRKRFGRITQHGRERAALVEMLRQLQPDVVHAHATGLYAAAALDSGLPTVITVHGIGFREAQLQHGWRNRFRGLLDSRFEQRNLRRAGHLIAISPYVQAEFPALTRAQVYAIENPIDARFFALESNPVPGRILFVGRVIARKAVHQLVAALAEIADELPQAHLDLAGEAESEPDYVASLRQRILAHGLQERVRFLGSLSTDQLADAYAQAACVALPSTQETAPVVIEEAMAVGLPVIATPVGGVSHMIEAERTGLLVPVGDARALAAQLRRLLSDAGLRARLGQAAKAEATTRFHPTTVADKTYAAYVACLGNADHE